MRDAGLTLCLLLAPLVAVAQPEDKDCGDFSTRMQAQGTYLAAQEITGQKDYHRLDRDGNGVACESIDIIQRDTLSATDSAHVETTGRTATVTCPDTSFVLQDFVKATREGFEGEGVHTEWHTMMDCVDLHLSIKQSE